MSSATMKSSSLHQRTLRIDRPRQAIAVPIGSYRAIDFADRTLRTGTLPSSNSQRGKRRAFPHRTARTNPKRPDPRIRIGERRFNVSGRKAQAHSGAGKKTKRTVSSFGRHLSCQAIIRCTHPAIAPLSALLSGRSASLVRRRSLNPLNKDTLNGNRYRS